MLDNRTRQYRRKCVGAVLHQASRGASAAFDKLAKNISRIE